MSQFLRPVSDDDLRHVSRHMRQADRRECYASAGMGPELALTFALSVSEEAYSLCTLAGEAAGMCGIAPGHTPGDKQVWMLGTDAILRHRRLFLRESKLWINQLTTKYTLWNFVDERNAVHIRWLKSLGCVFHGSKTSPYTGTQLLFFAKV
jgi:hypothetical protein